MLLKANTTAIVAMLAVLWMPVAVFSQNVGVGTSFPGAKLQITANGNTSTTDALFVINSSGDTLFIIQDDGNIGIANGAPQTVLEVANNDNGFYPPTLMITTPDAASHTAVDFGLDAHNGSGRIISTGGVEMFIDAEDVAGDSANGPRFGISRNDYHSSSFDIRLQGEI